MSRGARRLAPVFLHCLIGVQVTDALTSSLGSPLFLLPFSPGPLACPVHRCLSSAPALSLCHLGATEALPQLEKFSSAVGMPGAFLVELSAGAMLLLELGGPE